jgi:hypothetical protein
MSCSRMSAIRRLINLFIQRAAEDDDFADRVTIADVLSEENVQTVCKLDLYPDHDHPPLAFPSYDRDMQLLRAWLSSPVGRVQ